MTVMIEPGLLAGAVTPPPSKSQAHRLLIARALAAMWIRDRGRLQSRVYTKRLGETSEERTAFEVSVSVLERLDAPAPAEQPCG